MSVLYVVLPLALIFAGGAVAAFIWAARQGQFDDLSTPSMRILDDADVLPAKGGEGRRVKTLGTSNVVPEDGIKVAQRMDGRGGLGNAVRAGEPVRF